PKHPPHGRSIAAGSGTVMVDGKPAARAGDPISCGGALQGGSSVNIG
ncbi:PAAR domain-containing protein, partial [Vibrio gazogenes]